MELASQGKGQWSAAAKWALVNVALEKAEFTTDDVWRAGLVPCPNGTNRALGPVLMAAAKAGIIERTDRTRNTEIVTSHARPKRVWLSKLI